MLRRREEVVKVEEEAKAGEEAKVGEGDEGW